MIVPPGVDIATVTLADLVAAYVEMGYDREDAEASAEVLLGGGGLPRIV